MLPLKRVVFKDSVRLGKLPDDINWDYKADVVDIVFDKDTDSVVLTHMVSGDTIDVPRTQVRFWCRRAVTPAATRGPGRPRTVVGEPM